MFMSPNPLLMLEENLSTQRAIACVVFMMLMGISMVSSL